MDRCKFGFLVEECVIRRRSLVRSFLFSVRAPVCGSRKVLQSSSVHIVRRVVRVFKPNPRRELLRSGGSGSIRVLSFSEKYLRVFDLEVLLHVWNFRLEAASSQCVISEEKIEEEAQSRREETSEWFEYSNWMFAFFRLCNAWSKKVKITDVEYHHPSVSPSPSVEPYQKVKTTPTVREEFQPWIDSECSTLCCLHSAFYVSPPYHINPIVTFSYFAVC